MLLCQAAKIKKKTLSMVKPKNMPGTSM